MSRLLVLRVVAKLAFKAYTFAVRNVMVLVAKNKKPPSFRLLYDRWLEAIGGEL